MINRLLAEYYSFENEAIRRLRNVYTLFRTLRILNSLRSPGKRYCIRVNTLKTSREDVIRLLKEEGIEASRYRFLNDVIYIKVKGPFQVKKHSKIVIADKAAAESVYMGANLYGPGVLKTINVKEGDLVSIYSPLGHLVAEGVARMDGPEMTAKKRGLAVETTNSVYKVPHIRELDVYKRGLIYDQSLPSILSIHILNPEKGWKIVDMCASPGGKTTLAAQLMENDGIIYAIDRTDRKTRRIRENCKRLGINIVQTFNEDSRFLYNKSIFYDADAIILDPPCSALGVRPKLYYNRSEDEFKSFEKYQRQFIETAVKLLKPGGLLLYTTCTLTLEENEQNILWAIKNFKLKIIKQKLFMGSPGIGVINDLTLTQRYEPDKHDTPGFFIALLRKLP